MFFFYFHRSVESRIASLNEQFLAEETLKFGTRISKPFLFRVITRERLAVAINARHVHFHLRYAPANREANLRRHTPLISHREKDRRVNSVGVTLTNALCSSWTEEKRRRKLLSILSTSIYDNGDRTVSNLVAPLIFFFISLDSRHFVEITYIWRVER